MLRMWQRKHSAKQADYVNGEPAVSIIVALQREFPKTKASATAAVAAIAILVLPVSSFAESAGGAYAYDDSYYDDGGCYVVQRRMHTRYGWHLRPVQVCG